MQIEIRQVDDDNRQDVLALRVGQGQEGFIETVCQCLEDAKTWDCFVPVGLYCNKILVGFAMYGLFPREGRLWLDRLLIDRAQQGRGVGRES